MMDLEALRAAIRVEIRWHENEAKLNREAVADLLLLEEACDEAWQCEHDAKMHEDAADRLAVILYAHTPPPEPEIAF
jgi:3'-phosphoadenosine 5'-phosphosulfate sulfotransferase